MTSLFVGVSPVALLFLPTAILLQLAVLGFFVVSYLVLHGKVKHP